MPGRDASGVVIVTHSKVIAAVRTLNQIQQLTPEQQKRCYFATVSTNRVMADGTRQNNAQAQVRFRDGSMHYVRDLPMIDPSNPQPNGDYSISIDKAIS